jgi:hypothetical protein
MGQHKYNPTSIAAAKGELPPKPKKLSKRESERRILYAKRYEILYKLFDDTYKRIQENERLKNLYSKH